MTVSKTTTQDLVHEFIERKVRELAIGSGVLMQDLFCEFVDSLTAELQKENARLREALRMVADGEFAQQGYTSAQSFARGAENKILLRGVNLAALSKEKE